MRITLERIDKRPRPPQWAVLVVVIWLSVVGSIALLNARTTKEGKPPAATCLIKRTTGLPCPTCGSTRIVLQSARGKLLASLLQNPLVFVGMITGCVWVILVYGFKRLPRIHASAAERKLLWTCLALILIINWAWVIAIDGPWDNRLQSRVEKIVHHNKSSGLAIPGH